MAAWVLCVSCPKKGNPSGYAQYGTVTSQGGVSASIIGK